MFMTLWWALMISVWSSTVVGIVYLFVFYPDIFSYPQRPEVQPPPSPTSKKEL